MGGRLVRLILLTQYYDPEPVIYPHQLARGMVERGHEVVAVTGYPSYPKGRIYPGYRQRPWRRETLDGVRVVRLPLYPDHSLSTKRRLLYYGSFTASSALLAPFLSGPADVVFVFQPISLGLTGWLLEKLRGAPFVFNVQDMYPESILTVNISERSAIYRSIGAFARWVYGEAAAVSVISPGFKRNLVEKGVPAEKVEVICNWADDAVYRPVARDPELAAELGMTGAFTVVYAGNMGPPQGLLAVVEAAARLRETPGVRFLLVGEGNEKGRLEARARELRLENLRFLPRQEAARMPAIYANADALLVHLTEDPLFEITIPSKTQSYLACGRPIVMAVKGDAAAVVREAGAGVTARPSDPADIARAVLELHRTSPEERERIGRAGRAYYVEHLSAAAQIGRYERLFARVARGRAAA